jgi:hypothetical protein
VPALLVERPHDALRRVLDRAARDLAIALGSEVDAERPPRVGGSVAGLIEVGGVIRGMPPEGEQRAGVKLARPQPELPERAVGGNHTRDATLAEPSAAEISSSASSPASGAAAKWPMKPTGSS